MTESANDFDKIQSRFEKDAKAFDSIYSSGSEFNTWFNRKFRQPIFERFDIAVASLGDMTDKTVLDIGCGSGIYSVHFASRGARKVTGVDFSAPMLEIAKKRSEEHQLNKICEFCLGNFLDLDLGEKYNYSIAMGVFDYLADPVPFLKKMKEVTTDKIVISLPGNSLIRGPLRKLRYMLTSKGRVYYYTKEKIEAMVRSVGFSRYELVPGKTGKGYILIAQP